MSELHKTYKGYAIDLEPFEQRCSRFRATVTDPDGNEIKHIPMAGKTEEVAFSQAAAQIDFELEMAADKRRRREKRVELGFRP